MLKIIIFSCLLTIAVQEQNWANLQRWNNHDPLLAPDENLTLNRFQRVVPDRVPKPFDCAKLHTTEDTLFVAILLNRNTGRLLCMGSIIDERHILTANKCVQHTNHKTMKILLGYFKAYWGRHSYVYYVEKVIKHEHGLVLLRLTRSIQFSRTIRPIKLLRESDAVPSSRSMFYRGGDNAEGNADTNKTDNVTSDDDVDVTSNVTTEVMSTTVSTTVSTTLSPTTSTTLSTKSDKNSTKDESQNKKNQSVPVGSSTKAPIIGYNAEHRSANQQKENSQEIQNEDEDEDEEEEEDYEEEDYEEEEEKGDEEKYEEKEDPEKINTEIDKSKVYSLSQKNRKLKRDSKNVNANDGNAKNVNANDGNAKNMNTKKETSKNVNVKNEKAKNLPLKNEKANHLKAKSGIDKTKTNKNGNSKSKNAKIEKSKSEMKYESTKNVTAKKDNVKSDLAKNGKTKHENIKTGTTKSQTSKSDLTKNGKVKYESTKNGTAKNEEAKNDNSNKTNPTDQKQKDLLLPKPKSLTEKFPNFQTKHPGIQQVLLVGFPVTIVDVVGDPIPQVLIYSMKEEDVLPAGDCIEDYKPKAKADNKDENRENRDFCSPGTSKFCWGCLGGPTLFKKDEQYIQVGVVGGADCEKKDAKYIHFRVDIHMDWILANSLIPQKL